MGRPRKRKHTGRPDAGKPELDTYRAKRSADRTGEPFGGHVGDTDAALAEPKLFGPVRRCRARPRCCRRA